MNTKLFQIEEHQEGQMSGIAIVNNGVYPGVIDSNLRIYLLSCD
jgi:hypothetical protein